MPQRLHKRLTFNYLLALGVIAILTVVSYIIIEINLEKKAGDARLINISARQRTLSQKIARTALTLEHAHRNQEYTLHLNTLQKDFTIWQHAHKALQEGNDSLGLLGNNSKVVKEMFTHLTPAYQGMRDAVELILAIRPNMDSLMYTTLNIAIDRLLKHEGNFERTMDEITFQFDKEVQERLNQAKRIELYITIIILLALLLEGSFIFAPSVRKTVQFFQEAHQKRQELQNMNDDLRHSEEQIKQQTEEIRSSEEEIRQNMEELAAINENLMRSTEELKQKNEVLKEATEVLDMKNREIRRNRDQLFETNQQLEAKNEAIKNSIRYARRIQEAIIPDPIEVTSHFKEAFILFHPRDIVSGDFYWFSDKHGKKVIIAADCTGHGVPGALMTMMGNSLINQIVNEEGITNPSEILTRLDDKIIDTLQKPGAEKQIHDGMDMAVMTIDTDKNIIEFSAAHNPLYYTLQGEIQQIKGSKFPVGSSQYKSEKVFEYHQIEAQAGDCFYLFTDGFQDQYGADAQRKYMSKRFRGFIQEINAMPMSEQFIRLDAEFNEWKGESPQTDDILIIGVRM
jgi:serine phosphatase RsbU (regulator of sigma subunit)